MTDQARMRVVDLSHHNVIPQDLVAAKHNGVWGIIHKATEGASYKDSKYEARRHLAKQAGLLFGAYHFLRPGNMADQARFFVDTADPQGGMLLAADHEDAGVSLDDLKRWLDVVEDLTATRPVIYSGHVLKDQLKGKGHISLNGDNYRLWLAQYSSNPVLPPGWDDYWIWQWTDKGEIPGINPPVDLNQYDGIWDDFKSEWSGEDGTVEPPETAMLTFGDAIEALKQGMRVTRVGWNGKGMWLQAQVPDANSKMTLPYIYMSTVTGDLVPWIASQTDMFAEDWMIV